MKAPKHIKTFYVLQWGHTDTLTESKAFPSYQRAKSYLFTIPEKYPHFKITKHVHEGVSQGGNRFAKYCVSCNN